MVERSIHTLVILPGIGGHPDFHAFLIEHLKELPGVEVKSFPHGDFFSEPFSLSAHVKYWDYIILNEIAHSDGTAILGISFGTVIIQSLPASTLEKLSAIFLCSPVTGSRFTRGFASALQILDFRLTAKLFGKMMFWWSERKVGNPEHLAELRNRLYDNQNKVYTRLWKRLLSVKDLPDFNVFIKNTNGTALFLLFGKSENLRFLRPSNKDLQLHYFDGDHSLLINESTSLLSILTQLIFDLNGETI